MARPSGTRPRHTQAPRGHSGSTLEAGRRNRESHETSGHTPPQTLGTSPIPPQRSDFSLAQLRNCWLNSVAETLIRVIEIEGKIVLFDTLRLMRRIRSPAGIGPGDLPDVGLCRALL